MQLPWQKDSTNQSGLPPEVQQYYQASRKERTSVAWLLAFTTLAITVMVAFGAFFAGRWVYRKIAGDDKPTVVVTAPKDQTDEKPTEPKPTSPKTKVSKPKKQQPSANTPATPTTGPSTGLANTGPGSTLAAFIITATLGTGLYQIRLRKKANS